MISTKVKVKEVFYRGIRLDVNGHDISIFCRCDAQRYHYYVNLEAGKSDLYFIMSRDALQNLLKALDRDDRKVLGIIRLIGLFADNRTRVNYLEDLLYRYPVDDDTIEWMVKRLKTGLLISAVSWKQYSIIEPAVEVLNELGYGDLAEELRLKAMSHTIKNSVLEA